jgi:hypothetical protein
MDMGESFDQDATYRMWETIIGQMAKAEIEVRSTHILAPLDKESAMGMLRALSVEPDTRRRKNSKPWVRSVGVIDCFHLKAAESLGATHFLTTDRCLSKVETDMVMMLIGIYGNSADILRPSLLVRRQKKSRGEQILREEAVLTCRQPAAVEE